MGGGGIEGGKVNLPELRHILASLPPINPGKEGSVKIKRRKEKADYMSLAGTSLCAGFNSHQSQVRLAWLSPVDSWGN